MISISNLLKKFEPAFIFNNRYMKSCNENKNDKIPFLICIQKNEENIFHYKTNIITTKKYHEQTLTYIERLVKSILWIVGGHTIFIHTKDKKYFDYLSYNFSSKGHRSWDNFFIVKQIYKKDLTFMYCEHLKEIPTEKISIKTIQSFSNGNRIGIDLGGSDKKIASIKDGKILFSKSIIWNPFPQKNIDWHKKEIESTLDMAKKYLPTIDAVGASVPGICEDDRIKVSSIFQGLNNEQQLQSQTLINDIVKRKWNVPFSLANDGDVSALVGSIKFKEKNLLAIAMGTSMACGYINNEGNFNNFFNELAFVPVDYSNNAPNDPWSNDIGCGSQYFSQQAVIRLAKELNIPLDYSKLLSENLIIIQDMLENKNEQVSLIFETIGHYLAYSLLHYRQFYNIKSLLLLGRVLKGKGGRIIIETTTKKLLELTPNDPIKIHTMSEEEVLHSQAISASMIPKILPQ